MITKFWKGDYRGFLNFNVGLLGLINKAYDELLINALLLEKMSKNEIQHIYDRHKVKNKADQLDYLVNLFEKDEILIYGCKACLECTQVKLKVKYEENYYHWSINPEHQYKFDKTEYENELKKYKFKIRNNTFDNFELMDLYQFK